MGERDYQSICAGGDWWACSLLGGQFQFSRIVVFATRADAFDDERNEVVGIDRDNLNDRLNQTAKDDVSFVGYVHSDDFLDVGATLKPEIEDYLRALEVPKSERI